MMSYRQVIIVVLVASLFVAYVVNAKGHRNRWDSVQSPKMPDVEKGLQISAQVLGDSFRMDDVMMLQIKLKNVSIQAFIHSSAA